MKVQENTIKNARVDCARLVSATLAAEGSMTVGEVKRVGVLLRKDQYFH